MSFTKILVFVVTWGLLYPVKAQQLDPTFMPSASRSYGLVLDFEKQPDGKTLIAGDFQSFDDIVQPCLLRVNSNGTVDPTFNTGTGFDHRVQDVQLQPDGKVLVLGYFTTFNGQPAKHLIRLNADGSRDNSFSTGSFDAAPLKLTLQDDGKILVTGPFAYYNGIARRTIVRLNSDGSLDTNLNFGSLNGLVFSVIVQNDNKILIGGDFTMVNGVVKTGICRLNADGTLDNTFNGSGAKVTDIKILSSGKILVGGRFSSFNSVSKQNIVRLNLNGSLDNSFLASADGEITQITVMEDNSICISGLFSNVNSISTGSYALLTENGGIVSGFQLKQISGAQQIIAQGDKLVVSGNESITNKLIYKVVRLNSNGSLDLSFNQNARFRQAGGVITAVQLQSGKIIIGGSILLPDGTEKNHFVRLHRDGTHDNTFNIGNGPNGYVNNILILPDDKILVAGKFTTFGSQAVHPLMRLNSDGSVDNSFTAPLSDNFGTIFSLLLQPEGKIIVSGSFTGRMIRLNSDGTVDGSFNVGTGADAAIFETVLQPDGKIIAVGIFSTWNGAPATNIIRLLANGSRDPSFTSPTSFGTGFPRTASLDADGKIVVGGYFNSFNSTPATSLVRLNTNGTLDMGFNPNLPGPFNPVAAVEIDKDNKILIGKSKFAYEQDHPTYFFRLTPNGEFDDTFRFEGPNDGVETIMIDIDGRIIVSGAFTRVNDVARNGMFAILPPLPATPSDIEAVLESATSIHITWEDANESELGFIIERSLASPLSFTVIDTTLANVFEYTDEGLEPGSTYIYRVASMNSAGPSDFVNSNPIHVENITGLEHDKTKSVQIWKRSTGEYTVQTHWTNGFHLGVYDLMGRPVYSTQSKSEELNFYPGIHRRGIYIFRIVSGGEVFTQKIAD